MNINKEILVLAVIGSDRVVTPEACFIYHNVSLPSGSICKHTFYFPSFPSFLILDVFLFFFKGIEFFISVNGDTIGGFIS